MFQGVREPVDVLELMHYLVTSLRRLPAPPIALPPRPERKLTGKELVINEGNSPLRQHRHPQ